MVEWPAAEQRPPGYPGALPFVPGLPVRIEDAAGVIVMTWLAVERPADLVQHLIGACATSGWRRTGPAAGSAPTAAAGSPVAAGSSTPVAAAGSAPVAAAGSLAAGQPGAPALRARFAAGDSERVIEAVHAGRFSFVTLTERGILQT